jgi:hypothetical protein
VAGATGCCTRSCRTRRPAWRCSRPAPALVPPYATLPVLDGRLALGTWQSLCLVDLNVDNHEREVRFSFLAG